MRFLRRSRAFSNTLRFSKLVTLMIVDVLCVVYSVFLSQGLMNSKMLSAALARASAKSERRTQLRLSHKAQVPLRRPSGSDIV